jgi:hypothetical protein
MYYLLPGLYLYLQVTIKIYIYAIFLEPFQVPLHDAIYLKMALKTISSTINLKIKHPFLQGFREGA